MLDIKNAYLEPSMKVNIHYLITTEFEVCTSRYDTIVLLIKWKECLSTFQREMCISWNISTIGEKIIF